MKFFVLFVSIVATVSAYDLRNAELKQGNVSVFESEARIYNGQNAKVGQIPYIVGLKLTRNDNQLLWCGGSLISRTYVLTAAHCLEPTKTATIYFGATKRTSPEKEVKVDKANYIIHEDYKHNSLNNDIALIKFPPITYSDKTRPIALPHDISCSNPSLVGRYVVNSGWGRATENGNVVEDLQYIHTAIISNKECAKRYPGKVYDTDICVSNNNGSSQCKGDSGGPVVLLEENYLVGLYSRGYCETGIPEISTRVSSYMPWIRKHTGIGS